jgi:hypothetical protein
VVLAEQENIWFYVITSYVLVFGVIGIYAAITIARGRKLSKRLPTGQRRWLASEKDT